MDDLSHIYVIGCGIASELTTPAQQILNRATVVAGGHRLLAQFANKHHRQVIIGANAVATIKELIKLAETEQVVILASGDALFYGIAGTLSSLISAEHYTVLPNITAFQALCAKLNLPWSGFELFSIHGKNGIVPWRRLLAAEKAVIYCDNRLSATDTAAYLIDKYPPSANRSAVVAANLGMTDEFIKRGSLLELSQYKSSGLSILLLLKPTTASEYPNLPLGLDDNHYQHENGLITHPEIRAVILAKLFLRGGVMWDLGAGSGAVGLEAAGLCRNLQVYAVEKSSDRVRQIAVNMANEGLSNYQAIHADIIEQLPQLPEPDIVFIGGGGKHIKTIVTKAFERLKPGGKIVVSAVTLETIAALSSVLKASLAEVVTVGVSRSKPVGSLTMMKAENQITVFTYRKD